ncbi:MAG: tetratricopeptide repeat protein [Methanosarcinales archaeon]|nr:MAG: tetratricopeptide repeat protein [Methanosarcinales archaeon]
MGISQEIRDKAGESTSIGNIGIAYRHVVEIKKAIEYYEKTLNIAREIGDKTSECVLSNNIGENFLEAKKYKEALACFIVSKDIFTKLENPNVEQYELNLNKLEKELGEKAFEKLLTR